jgi:ribosomal protein S12 methylthiotransferase
MQVLVENSWEQGYLARSYADAPEIDGLIYIETDQELVQGEFCDVEITASDEYDCYAQPLR